MQYIPGLSVRITALDAMTNIPIMPPPFIDYLLSVSHTQGRLPSPATIQNVSLNENIIAFSNDSNHLPAIYFGNAFDVLNDQVMDITLALSPILVIKYHFFIVSRI